MEKAKFFDAVRSSLFGGKLTSAQVVGMEYLLDAMSAAKWPVAYAANGLSTTYHETDKKMEPIAEYGHGKGKKYGGKTVYGGQIAYGRGYVQLTWADPSPGGIDNYAKADKALGLGGALLKDFDLALRHDIAAAILVRGMDEGWFTGKKNADYLKRTPADYLGARRIINGTDKAAMIADYSVKFAEALKSAGYGTPVAAPASKEPAPSPNPAVPVSTPKPAVTPTSFWQRLVAAFRKAVGNG